MSLFGVSLKQFFKGDSVAYTKVHSGRSETESVGVSGGLGSHAASVVASQPKTTQARLPCFWGYSHGLEGALKPIIPCLAPTMECCLA